MEVDMGKMRGRACIAGEEYIKKIAGAAALDQVIVRLSSEDRNLLFQKPVGTLEWVDYGAALRFLQTADEFLGNGDGKLIQAAAQYSARKQLQDIHKILKNLRSPQAIINKMSRLWGQFYDCGKLSVEKEGQNHMVVKLTDFTDIPLHHEVQNMALLEECINLVGGHNVHGTHPKCMARGDDWCEFSFEWE
jgi:predicted hydrocarbon binding protein